MFDNRLSWLKILLALGAVSALGWAAHRALGRRYPSVEAIRAFSERHEGREAFFVPTEIRAVSPGGFVVEKDGIPLVVRARGDWTPGTTVVIRGRVRGGAVDADSVRAYPGYRRRRFVMYAVSAVVAVALVLLLLRRTDLRRGLLESRY